MKTKFRVIIPIAVAVITVIAAALFINFTPQEKDDVSSLLSTAQKYLIEYQYEQAIAEFNKIIEIDPKNADAYLGLAEAYVGIGDTDKAVEVLKKGYAVTEDERLKNMIDILEEDDSNVTITLNQSDSDNILNQSGSDNILFYSDGTVRCQKTFLSDGGYILEWFEPNAHCMLTETYDFTDKIIYVKYYGSFEENIFIVEAVPELSENGYIISSDSMDGIKYEFNFDGKLVKAIYNNYFSKQIISYEYPSERTIIAAFDDNYNNFYSYTKEQIEYIDNKEIKITYFRDNFTLGYSITEAIDEKKHRISYYEEDNTFVGYKNSELTDELTATTMYSADGRLLSESEYKKESCKFTSYDLNGQVIFTNSTEYKDNKYVSYCNGFQQYESIAEWLSDGSIKKTYSGDMYDESEVEIEEHTNAGYTVTHYDKDGNVMYVTSYENNSRTLKETYYTPFRFDVSEWTSPTQIKRTNYDEYGNIIGYSLSDYSSLKHFLGIEGESFKSYSSDGTLESEWEITYGNNKGTLYNPDGTVFGINVTTQNNGIFYTKFYRADGTLSSESESDSKGNGKSTNYNPDGTLAGTSVTTKNNGIFYTKDYRADGTLSYESESDSKGNGKSTSYYPNGAVSSIDYYSSDGSYEYYSYDENGELVSHKKNDKNGNEIN